MKGAVARIQGEMQSLLVKQGGEGCRRRTPKLETESVDHENRCADLIGSRSRTASAAFARVSGTRQVRPEAHGEQAGPPQFTSVSAPSLIPSVQVGATQAPPEQTPALHSACNQTFLRATGERQFLADVCRLVVERGGYRMAWIGMKDVDAARSLVVRHTNRQTAVHVIRRRRDARVRCLLTRPSLGGQGGRRGADGGGNHVARRSRPDRDETLETSV